MTEEQIRDGYDRLDGALAPPPDAALRVGRRVATRRRRRRTAVAGAATLGVLAVGGTVVALASGDSGDGTPVATDTGPAPVSTLVLTRPDGSTYAFDDVTVSCEHPDDLPSDDGTTGPQRIWAVSPRVIKDDRAVEPFVYFEGVVSKIAGDRTFTFPADWSTPSASWPMVLFAADTDGNEVSSGEEVTPAEGRVPGTVRVVEASCSPTPVLRLEVDATIGSEVGHQALRISGSLR